MVIKQTEQKPHQSDQLYTYVCVGWFLGMPSSGFQHFDANWQYFDVPLIFFFFGQADFQLLKILT